MREPPYPTELKPYGRALVDLARRRGEVLCLSGDLTRQTEVDLFQAEFPDRFIHGGMAEANMMSMAGALARCGYLPFVHTFGVFATRRPFDQIANAIAYPNLPVRIIGFMPGVSTPGGPSHQAIDDVALMRALPNMTVVDVADAVETRQVVAAIADVPGPVYVRLKRGEIPVIFDDDHVLRLGRAEVVLAGHGRGAVRQRDDARRRAGRRAGTRRARSVGLGRQRADDQAAGFGHGARRGRRGGAPGGHGREPLDHRRPRLGRRRDDRRGRAGPTAAPGRAAGHLCRGLARRPVPLRKYGLSTAALVGTIWSALGRAGPVPAVPAAAGEAASTPPSEERV